VKIDPIITMDSMGTIQSASDSIEQVFGWTPVELCGQNINTLIPEPRRSALDRFLDRYRNPGRAKTSERVRRFDAVCKNGSIITIELSVSRADLPGRAGSYFVGLIRDVTRQVDVEADTPAARSRLQRFLTEQTRALASAHLRLQLSDRLASLGTLAAGLGHDLNNVLLPIRARLNAIEHAGVSSAAMAHLEEVRRALIYLQHLSDGLHVLSVDPKGTGERDAAARPTHLATWWGQVGVLLRTAVPRKVRITANLPSGLPSVLVEPPMLTQAMLNIIVNAGEAINPVRRKGEVIISAHWTKGQKTLRLMVSDNGRGMTRTVRAHALDPFFTTKPRAIGTGLGLPLARRVLERVGGHIELISTSGKGTTVVLVLPVARGTKGAGTDPTAGVRRAAVALGDRDATMLVTQLLAAAGFRVMAPNGQLASDVELWIAAPTGENLETAKRWRRAEDRRGIIVMGSPSDETRKAWAALGATVLPSVNDLQGLRLAIAHAARGAALSQTKRRTP
jgi:PAS domain S-box-containing protein